MKVGTPTDNELKELARDIANSWRKLGHRLGVSEAVLDSIDQENKRLSEKGYRMLIHWKQGAAASYKVLNDALRHEDVQRQDLAQRFCLDWHMMVIIIIFFYIKCMCCGFMVLNALDSGSSSLGLNPGRDHYAMFLGYTIYSGCTSFQPCRC